MAGRRGLTGPRGGAGYAVSAEIGVPGGAGLAGAGSRWRPRRIHDGIWPVLERYIEWVEDRSLRSADAGAARVFFFPGVSLRR